MEEFIQTNGIRLWTVAQGSGPPVMLCPGGPGCCDYLGPVADMIDDLAQVRRFDPRGCGRTEKTPPYDLGTSVADLEGIRRHFGIASWTLCGHSWGAGLALAYSLKHSHRVGALMYLSGTGITLDWKDEYHRVEAERPGARPSLAYPFSTEVNQAGNESWDEFVRSPDLEGRVAGLNVPALIVHGERDTRPAWPARQLAELMPQAEFRMLSGAEHYLWLARARQLRRVLRDFIKRVM